MIEGAFRSFALFSIAEQAEGAGYLPNFPFGLCKDIAPALIARLDVLAVQLASDGTFGDSSCWPLGPLLYGRAVVGEDKVKVITEFYSSVLAP